MLISVRTHTYCTMIYNYTITRVDFKMPSYCVKFDKETPLTAKFISPMSTNSSTRWKRKKEIGCIHTKWFVKSFSHVSITWPVRDSSFIHTVWLRWSTHSLLEFKCPNEWNVPVCEGCFMEPLKGWSTTVFPQIGTLRAANSDIWTYDMKAYFAIKIDDVNPLVKSYLFVCFEFNSSTIVILSNDYNVCWLRQIFVSDGENLDSHYC